MSIRSKLLLSFLFMTILIVTLFVIRQYFSIKENDLLHEIVLEHEISTLLSGLSTAAQKIRRYEKEYFIYVQNPTRRKKYIGEFLEAKEEIDQFIFALKTIYTRSNKNSALTILSEWEVASRFYMSGFATLNKRVKNGEIVSVIGANKAIQEYKNKFRVVLSGTTDSIKKQYELATGKAERIKQYQSTSSLIFAAISTISVIVALIISFLIPASIVKPLKQLTNMANGISKGKTSDLGEIKGSAEIEELAKSIMRLQSTTLGLLNRLQTMKNNKA